MKSTIFLQAVGIIGVSFQALQIVLLRLSLSVNLFLLSILTTSLPLTKSSMFNFSKN